MDISFKSIIEKLRKINKFEVVIEPYSIAISDALKNLSNQREFLEKAFEYHIIDEKDYTKKLNILKSKEDDLVNKNIRYGDAIILDNEGKLLLLRRSNSDDMCPECYCLPGGKIEVGETPMQGTIREVVEETGLNVISAELIMEKEIDNGCIYYFKCIVENKDNSQLRPVLDAEEHSGFIFATEKEIKEKLTLLYDLEDYLFDLVPEISREGSTILPISIGEDDNAVAYYSNIIEGIMHNSPVRIEKDSFMLDLFKNKEISKEEITDYIIKAYSDPSNGGKRVRIKKIDKNGKTNTKWVSKQELMSGQFSLFDKKVNTKIEKKKEEKKPKKINKLKAQEEALRGAERDIVSHDIHNIPVIWDEDNKQFINENTKEVLDTDKVTSYQDLLAKKDLAQKNYDAQSKYLGIIKDKGKRKERIDKFYESVEKRDFGTDYYQDIHESALKMLKEEYALFPEHIDKKRLQNIILKKIR